MGVLIVGYVLAMPKSQHVHALGCIDFAIAQAPEEAWERHSCGNTTVAELVRAAGTRWAIEEGFQAAKNECGRVHRLGNPQGGRHRPCA
ncbi:hypothetical protein [Streptomyces sp. NPDC059455]|uniref:hypothetical protein n=1 Tax=Streptomyces sp. NPDC059455 TaxID=3346837 RepID=UPI0036BF6997